MFEKQFTVAWVDVDANSHMRNTSYLERASDVRLMYFAERGFSFTEFRKMRFGPVVRRDEVEYFRELHLLDSFRVNFELAGLAEDASRMCLSHNFMNMNGQLLAKVRTTAGWLDLDQRKLIRPLPMLEQALRELPKTEDFEVLPSSLKN